MLRLKRYLYKPEIKSKSKKAQKHTTSVSNDAYMTTGGRGKQRAPATSVLKVSKRRRIVSQKIWPKHQKIR